MKGQSMQTTQSIIRRILDKAFNQGDLAIVDECVAADIITHFECWGMPDDRMGLKLFIATFRTAFPDLHCTVEDEIQEGNKFAAHWTMRGTNQGPFMGNAPTGKPVSVPGIIYGRYENGRIAQDLMLMDQLGLLQQLGIVPPPQRTIFDLDRNKNS